MSAAPDPHYMDIALRLSARALGSTWPNPAVGCVIVADDGEVLGRGWTAPSGRPHAETQALAQAGLRAKGATAYVSLEPCAHHGMTPPCAQALADAGVARVVIACADPDPRTQGKSIAFLKEHHVEVITGLAEKEAQRLNEGFFTRVSVGRPFITLKLATSRDGKLATKSGESKWITNEESRNLAHVMRAENDAVMIGSATALIDDPELTCRLEGYERRSPVRIVADGRLRLELTSRLVRTLALAPLWILTREGVDQKRARSFRDLGVTVFEIGSDNAGNLDMNDAVQALGEAGITRLLVEGGARLAANLLKADLVDQLAWFTAPLIIGGDGTDAVAALGLDKIGNSTAFHLEESRAIKDDMLALYRRMR